MANITVKADDGTTDVVYTALVASGGDRSPAVWRANASTGTPGQRPELRISSRNNGDNTARRIDGQFTFPSVYTDTNTSTTKVLNRANASFSAVLPADFPDASANEFGAQLGNLLAAALVEEILSTGYSAT
jgi:hypothetical protein